MNIPLKENIYYIIHRIQSTMKNYAKELQKNHIQEIAVQIDKILYHPINQSLLETNGFDGFAIGGPLPVISVDIHIIRTKKNYIRSFKLFSPKYKTELSSYS